MSTISKNIPLHHKSYRYTYFVVNCLEIEEPVMSENKNSTISFGEFIDGSKFKVLNERAIRANSGIMFLFGIIAFINGFILKQYIVIPYVSGILLFSFLVGVFINPKYSPIMFLSNWIVSKQTPIYVGAIQKRFAWSLGIILSAVIFVLSLFLLSDIKFFPPVCMLCLICLVLLFFETAFGICIGCKFYFLAVKLKLMKEPEVKPNCIGESCEK